MVTITASDNHKKSTQKNISAYFSIGYGEKGSYKRAYSADKSVYILK